MSKVEVNTVEPQCGTTLTVGKCTTTIAVPGNVVKSNALQASDAGNIISQCGTTVTIGATGDTVSLASGASQSGFGRSGSVNWDTASIKTANFTAVSGNGYFCNTSGGAFDLQLPAGPSAGDIVALKDYASSFAAFNLTLDRNGSNLNGAAANFAISTVNTSMTLVYVDGTEGWMAVEEGTGFIGENYLEVSCTGGTSTLVGTCKVHTFLGPGSFTVDSLADTPANNEISYLVVAGGGGGGYYYGGAGGAGGFREDKSPTTPYTASPLDGAGPVTVTATTYPVTVGGGGASAPYPSCVTGSPGTPSVAVGITSAGGGAGAGKPGSGNNPGLPGGSGGGGGGWAGGASGGTGNTPPTNPAQGKDGNSTSPGPGEGGGGGGALGTVPSIPAPHADVASGGVGAGTGINPASPVGTPGPDGALRYFSGGGAGGPPSPGPVTAGYGGGGPSCASGTINTGGGAGSDGGPTGKTGGSGIVIIRYKYG